MPDEEHIEPFLAEIRFDSYTFRDLPESDR